MRVARARAAVRARDRRQRRDLSAPVRRFRARSGGGFRRGRDLAQGDRGAEPRLCRGNARHRRRLPVRASRPSRSSTRATSWRSPCSGRRRRRKEPGQASFSKSGPTAAPPSASRPRRPTIATPGSARTGIGSKACMDAPSSCRRGERANRVSSASPRPASPAERWASTNAASGWSRTGSPRATMAAIPIASRSMCGAAKCWTRKHSNRRRGR